VFHLNSTATGTGSQAGGGQRHGKAEQALGVGTAGRRTGAGDRETHHCHHRGQQRNLFQRLFAAPRSLQWENEGSFFGIFTAVIHSL